MTDINIDTTLPVALYRAAQVQQGERQVAARAGIPMYDLMEAAGASAFALLQRRWPEVRAITVLCGKGNNGGDGYVVARLAKLAGWQVQLIHLGYEGGHDSEEPLTDAERAHRAWLASGGMIETFAGQRPQGEVMVDALLGTGFKGELRPAFAEAIRWFNQSGKPTLSLDLPSGLAADTGAVGEVAVRADVTVSFVALKQGLLTGQARAHCGELALAGLGIGEAFTEAIVPNTRRLCIRQFDALLAPRNPSVHKGAFKRVLLLGGDTGLGGAIMLAGQAALRTGAALVSALTREAHVLPLLSRQPEIMVRGTEQLCNHGREMIAAAPVLAIGPGLGQAAWGQELLQAALANPAPKVIDADGLNLLAGLPAAERGQQQWILTPHPGEAARLLGCTTAEVESDRFAAIRRLHQAYGGVVVLKGAGSLVYDGRQLYLANVGNPGMASGGMGDLLTGIIAGLLAQGADLTQAACAGVMLHGLAGDAAAREGERGLVASDLLPPLRRLLNPAPMHPDKSF